MVISIPGNRQGVPSGGRKVQAVSFPLETYTDGNEISKIYMNTYNMNLKWAYVTNNSNNNNNNLGKAQTIIKRNIVDAMSMLYCCESFFYFCQVMIFLWLRHCQCWCTSLTGALMTIATINLIKLQQCRQTITR